MFNHGDRVRWATMGDDGLPLVRYGFVGSPAAEAGPVLVMLDGELGGDVIDVDQLQPVAVTTVELHLAGDDLIDDPDLRRGLVSLWRAEAETAGLDVDALADFGDGRHDGDGGWSLARLTSGGADYVVRARRYPDDDGVVQVRADPAH